MSTDLPAFLQVEVGSIEVRAALGTSANTSPGDWVSQAVDPRDEGLHTPEVGPLLQEEHQKHVQRTFSVIARRALGAARRAGRDRADRRSGRSVNNRLCRGT